MKQGLNAGGGHLKILRVDAKNLILPFVPHPVAVDPIPIPGPHIARGDRHAATLFAFDKASGRFFQLGGPGANPILQLGIEPLQLPGLAIKLGKHLDLGAQHLRHHRYRNVIDRAHLVAPQPVQVADLNRRDEDHRRLLEPGMLADHGGQFEPVQFRHADVDQDHGDFVLEQEFKCLAP